MTAARLPHISVVMTCYNHATYIGDALASVLGQDYPAFDLCVVNDGSTDDSRARIAAVLADTTRPFRVIEQPNGGQANALNAGIAATHGDIVALMDGDDLWAPDKLSRMAAFIAQHPGGGVYQHQVDDGTGRPFRPSLPSGDMMADWRARGTLNTAVHPERLQINVPTSGLLFRREVLNALLPIPAVLVVCPDFYLFVLGLVHGPLYSEPATLATWRTHGANASHQQRFAFKTYWLPVVFPVVNAALAQRGVTLRLVFRRRALLVRPYALLRAVWRRVLRSTGRRID